MVDRRELVVFGVGVAAPIVWFAVAGNLGTAGRVAGGIVLVVAAIALAVRTFLLALSRQSASMRSLAAVTAASTVLVGFWSVIGLASIHLGIADNGGYYLTNNRGVPEGIGRAGVLVHAVATLTTSGSPVSVSGTWARAATVAGNAIGFGLLALVLAVSAALGTRALVLAGGGAPTGAAPSGEPTSEGDAESGAAPGEPTSEGDTQA